MAPHNTDILLILQNEVNRFPLVNGQFPPFRYFLNFSSLSKHTSTVKYRIYIWQVSPQLSCGDTCQIWMWFEESNMYFCEAENFAYGEINERSFSNPQMTLTDCMVYMGHFLTYLSTDNMVAI